VFVGSFVTFLVFSCKFPEIRHGCSASVPNVAVNVEVKVGVQGQYHRIENPPLVGLILVDRPWFKIIFTRFGNPT